jgi:hypothetical protein
MNEIEFGLRWPRTLRGWWDVLVGTLICDVLWRCSYVGCWKRKWGPTLLHGTICRAHWTELYSPEES